MFAGSSLQCSRYIEGKENMLKEETIVKETDKEMTERENECVSVCEAGGSVPLHYRH